MAVTIMPERPDTDNAIVLIGELDNYLTPRYPKWNQFGLSPENLIKEGVAFFITYVDSRPAGCGGVKFYDDFGELKRMYVRPQFRGKGLGKLILDYLEAYALKQGTTLLRLETGVYQPEAMRLYERTGYRQISAFPPYADCAATLSRFYEKRIVK